MKRYRFKTLEEFGGKRPSGWNCHGDMDKYMGQEIHHFEGTSLDSKCGTSAYFYHDNWSFRGTDIVEIEETNMKRINKEDWDFELMPNNIIGVEMQSGEKYFLQLNDEGVVPVNLKEHKNSDYSDTLNLHFILTTLNMLKGNKKVFQFNSMQDMIAWATS